MNSEAVTLAPQKGSQEVAMQCKADVIIYGGSAGSGKSHLELMHPLQHVNDPDFNAVFFRRVTKQLVGLGGLWQESQKMYRPFNPHVRQQSLTQTFPSGAEIQFSHMEHEKDRFQHQGLQYSAVYFDFTVAFSSNANRKTH
jgi:hypothetical protein